VHKFLERGPCALMMFFIINCNCYQHKDSHAQNAYKSWLAAVHQLEASATTISLA
jgi:hypothetical protein